MSKKFICGGNKYEIGGPNSDTIGLPVVLNNLPDKIIMEGYTLMRKTSFHCSLVCIGKIIEKNKIQISDFLNKVITEFCEFTKNNPIELLGYQNEFRFVSEKEKCSVVIMCDISNLNKFFNLINKKYKLNIEYPPTHVTLYTLQLDIGIFLTDSTDIKNLSRVIKIPTLNF